MKQNTLFCGVRSRGRNIRLIYFPLSDKEGGSIVGKHPSPVRFHREPRGQNGSI